MPVTKRTRYEVLKRDSHTCRYCGASAPDVKLTVDHVTPLALGGSDDPGNLVAACQDCNAGKSSASPDAALVEDVKQADIRWAGAIKRVAATRSRQNKKAEKYVAGFLDAWKRWTFGWAEEPGDLPVNWESSIRRFYDLGIPLDEVVRLVDVACGARRIGKQDAFRYFAGCVWRVVTEMQDAAKQLLAEEDGEPAAEAEDALRKAYMEGWWHGYHNLRKVMLRIDPVSAVVDHISFAEPTHSTDEFGMFYLRGIGPDSTFETRRGA